MEDLYYPCIMDWDTRQISKRVGPAMPHTEALDYIKQHHSSAWERANAMPQPVTHKFFAEESKN